jgi:hypothetical protein
MREAKMLEHLAWMQRRDAEYYKRAIAGHDPTHLLAAKTQLQREAAKASEETRNALDKEQRMRKFMIDLKGRGENFQRTLAIGKCLAISGFDWARSYAGIRVGIETNGTAIAISSRCPTFCLRPGLQTIGLDGIE